MNLAEISIKYVISKSRINGWIKKCKRNKSQWNLSYDSKLSQQIKKEMLRIKEEIEVLKTISYLQQKSGKITFWY